MNFAKISKALAGVSPAPFTGAGGAIVVGANAPSWEAPVLTGVVGFVVGFIGVYFAPANTPAK
jgi:hypothetical protein